MGFTMNPFGQSFLGCVQVLQTFVHAKNDLVVGVHREKL